MNKSLQREELLTAQEASNYLKISVRTLYKHIKEQRIPAFKLGRSWRFLKSELDNWLKQKIKESTKKGYE
jgi:excisionase family DNA binding protein